MTMKMLRRTVQTTALSLVAIAPATAATTFSGSLGVHAGYGNNPFLSREDRGGAALIGANLSLALSHATPVSTTTLSGVADLTQNTNHYGRTESFIAGLDHIQRLSETWTATAGASYSNTRNAAFLPGFGVGINQVVPTVVGETAPTTNTPVQTPVVTVVPTAGYNPLALDVVSFGQRTQQVSGRAGLQWSPSAVDSAHINGNVSHVIYQGLGADFTQYGGNFGYLRTLSARTKVGFEVSGTTFETDNFPRSSSFSTNAVLNQQITSYWLLNASVGAIFPRGGVGRSNSVTLGFSGSMCGAYPRYTVCFTAARQQVPSGVGQLRTNLSAGATLAYNLDELSTLNVGASISQNRDGNANLTPRERFYTASAGYNRRLSNRISAGVTGGYQRREIGGAFGRASGYSVSLNVTTSFGKGAR